MKHLGDITKINGAKIAPVDVIIGGSPCQDLSVAGKRAGLAGARSGLFMEQIRIVKEMRDATNGTRPRFMVWENVPGAFSSNKGGDFAAVLEETIRVVEPEAPGVDVPERGWPTWGQYRDVGGRWSVAWRVLDAQYWGVPQRRRRIAIIADFGGSAAGEILFNRKGVSRDSEPCGETRKGAAAGTESGAGESVWCLQGNGIDRSDTAGCNGRGWRENQSYTLNTVDRPAVACLTPWQSSEAVFCAGFKLGNSESARSIGYSEECAPTLNAECGGNKPAILDMTHANDVIRECGGIVPTLTSRMGTGGNQVPLTMRYRSFGDYEQSEHASTLKARNTPDNSDVVCGRFVRRLTPLECERLQGFPDGWTDIGDWTDSKGKTRKTSDTARYKALGNSIALPPWKWVLKRLCAEYERDATMGSLFDGIGGFPLIWEQLNGKGSCLWASEIEEFCIAVTQRRFGG
nr:MAG TPA: Cytosine specific methyltransferase [Caudoviricetes sp.]